MAKDKNYSVPIALQKLVIVTVVLSFVIDNSVTLYRAVNQYASNPNLSGFWWSFLALGCVPLIFYVLAAAINPRKTWGLSNVFENVLVALSGILVFYLVLGMYHYLTQIVSRFYADMPRVVFSMSGDLIAAGVATVLFGAILYYLRQTQRWN